MTGTSIQFGWAAPSFAQQLPALSQVDADRADSFNRAIMLLSVHGIITEAERDKAIRRATRRIEACLTKGCAPSDALDTAGRRNEPRHHQPPTG